ncbi:metal ABC transporter substrate-binding protein [Aquipuribacter hungaricus]|uniref:Metal ABC transporter substrate-binding protein n=1 Tax=Aquipuribacter hungaricus TaxID=545624 RepID=A0ABV7WHC0_9MICO
MPDRAAAGATASAAVAGALAASLLAGCGAGPTTVGAAPGPDGPLEVVASFYPLQYVVEQVGGDDVTVQSLTPPGSGGHDVELTPSQVAHLGEVDLVVHVSGGLQPATDDALDVVPPASLVDAADVVDLDRTGSEGSADPHFWLDPLLLADVGDAVAAALAGSDPGRAPAFAARAVDLRDRLERLDADLAGSLAPCDGAVLVTSHEAFGYLTDRYGIEQVALTGIDPEVPPSPARLRRAVETVEGRGVRTVFFERSTGPRVTAALADDLGLATAVLDPLEQQPSDGEDYEDVMRRNGHALADGLVCGS